MVSLLIPCAQFFYETDEEKSIMKRILEMLCYEFILLAVLITLLLIGFTYLGTAKIPIHTITQSFNAVVPASYEVVLSNFEFIQVFYYSYIVNK